jgi:hypothetical protein
VVPEDHGLCVELGQYRLIAAGIQSVMQQQHPQPQPQPRRLSAGTHTWTHARTHTHARSTHTLVHSLTHAITLPTYPNGRVKADVARHPFVVRPRDLPSGALHFVDATQAEDNALRPTPSVIVTPSVPGRMSSCESLVPYQQEITRAHNNGLRTR